MAAVGFPIRGAPRWILCLGVWLAAAAPAETVQAQRQDSRSPPEARVIVVGEGSVSTPPDYARIRSGVTTTAKTAKEAIDANSKLMAAVTTALLDAGIVQKDIQTAEFSIQPVYTSPTPSSEPMLSGYRVSNQVGVTIRQISKVGEVLDRLVTAGATDAGNVEFLLFDPSKVLDQAREAAVADARRKAELYAHASGFSLGRVAFITENTEFVPPVASSRLKSTAMAAVPIQPGEDALHARIVVGFDITQ